MRRNDTLFVRDIIAAMQAIEQFVEGLSLHEFKEDDKTSSAVIRKFEIIGEATKHIPEFVKVKYPDVPWKRMAGMRDRLIHAYFGVDYQLVWDAIKLEIRELKPRFKKILTELDKLNSRV